MYTTHRVRRAGRPLDRLVAYFIQVRRIPPPEHAPTVQRMQERLRVHAGVLMRAKARDKNPSASRMRERQKESTPSSTETLLHSGKLASRDLSTAVAKKLLLECTRAASDANSFPRGDEICIRSGLLAREQVSCLHAWIGEIEFRF